MMSFVTFIFHINLPIMFHRNQRSVSECYFLYLFDLLWLTPGAPVLPALIQSISAHMIVPRKLHVNLEGCWWSHNECLQGCLLRVCHCVCVCNTRDTCRLGCTCATDWRSFTLWVFVCSCHSKEHTKLSSSLGVCSTSAEMYSFPSESTHTFFPHIYLHQFATAQLLTV